MNALSRDQLRTVCPSIFTRTAYHRLSDRYKVAATADVVDLLEDQGLYPVQARQSRCRLPDKQAYSKHLIRFRRPEHMDAQHADEVPEVVLTNSFDGSTAYQILLGIHRVICSNGLVCPISDLGGFSVRHKGGSDFNRRILEATARVVDEAPNALQTVRAWKETTLTAEQQIDFARRAWELKPNPAINPMDLLTPRRAEDYGADLWRVYNRTEEAIIKGGLTGINHRGRRIRTRPITSVHADLLIHRRLWELATEYANN